VEVFTDVRPVTRGAPERKKGLIWSQAGDSSRSGSEQIPKRFKKQVQEAEAGARIR
jgi:hypothetical protein